MMEIIETTEQEIELLKKVFIEGIASAFEGKNSCPYTYRGSNEREVWFDGYDAGEDALDEIKRLAS